MRQHQLKVFEECGYPPSFEYFLPVETRDVATWGGVSNWIRELAVLPPVEAYDLFRRRWAGAESSCCWPLHQELLEFRPGSVLVHEELGWVISMRRRRILEVGFFAPPQPRAFVAEWLAEFGFEDLDLIDFVTLMAGFRESVYPSGGSFISPEHTRNRDEILMTGEWMYSAIANFRPWDGSLVVFRSRGGSVLLIQHSGKVGWWLGGEPVIDDYAESVEELVDKYVHFLQSDSVKKYRGRFLQWPFDPPRAMPAG